MRSKKAPPAAPAPSPRLRNLIAAAVLCALTLLAYSNSFQTGFAFDNKGLLLQAPQIREATSHNIALIFQHTYWWPLGEAGLYRPFTTLSYLFNYAVLGGRDQSAGYHWINFILHAGNVLLVFALALRLVRTFWPCVFIASLWAVHPVLTESVTNIVGRADLLAAMAVLSGFLMYLKSTEAEGRRRRAWLAGLMAVTTVGVFSKESAVAILGVIVLYELTWWKGQARALLLGCLAILPPLAAMLVQRWYVLAHSPPAVFLFTDNPIVGAGFWQGRLTAIKVIAHCLLLTVWPATLSSDYSYSQIPLARGSVQDWLAWIVVGVLAAGVVLLYRWNRTAFFFACFAIVNFVPMSNLLFPIGTIMAERFLYVPSIGLVACLALGVYAGAERTRIAMVAPVVLCIIAAAFVIRTRARNLDWQDDVTLSTAAVEASPNSYKAHRLLGLSLFESDPTPFNVDRAIDETEKSMALLDSLPDSINKTDPYLLAGMLYITKGDRLRVSPEGPKLYQRGLQIALKALPIVNRVPGDPSAYQLLSGLYLRLGDLDHALDAGTSARALDPFSAQIHRQLAYVLLAKHRVEDAAIALAEGLAITSDPGLRDELINMYRQGVDQKGCAIMQGTDGPALNPTCETVRRHFCAASVETVQASLRAGRRDLAESQKKNFLTTYGCPAGPLDEVLR